MSEEAYQADSFQGDSFQLESESPPDPLIIPKIGLFLVLILKE